MNFIKGIFTTNEILKAFWSIVSFTILGFFYLGIEYNWTAYSKAILDAPFFVLIVTVFLILFIYLWFNVRQKLKREKIRQQGSYLFYAYYAFFAAPLFATIIKSLVGNQLITNKWEWVARSLFLGLGLIIYQTIKPLDLDVINRKFASGSIGADVRKDKLNFLPSAKNTAQGILKLPDFINVVALYGGFGEGKSSYARMIIESMDANKVLYTYISLTETNEAKDFSKLFAERWLDTLKERYPKIDLNSCLPVLHNILRESGNGIMSYILDFISNFNPGLLKTKAKIFDEHYHSKGKIYIESDVAKMFGNIPEILEEAWVIIIDEIERAQFDEIYRIVEIIERFKNEGRTGLPVRIIFLLCLSKSDLEKLLNTFSSIDSRAYLLKTFFFEDPKNITQNLFLPPIDPEIKKAFVIEQLKAVTQKYGIILPDINNV